MNTRPVTTNGGEKSRRVNLGLAVLRTRVRAGVRVDLNIIAAYCDCAPQAVWMMEQRALAKLRQRLPFVVRRELLERGVKV